MNFSPASHDGIQRFFFCTGTPLLVCKERRLSSGVRLGYWCRTESWNSNDDFKLRDVMRCFFYYPFPVVYIVFPVVLSPLIVQIESQIFSLLSSISTSILTRRWQKRRKHLLQALTLGFREPGDYRDICWLSIDVGNQE